MIDQDRPSKSDTDVHWNERALQEQSDARVNIADLVQRSLENQFILSLLRQDARILEVGCGNGYLTAELRKHVRSVDAFDYSENMIARAKQSAGESNSRFFLDNVLAPRHVEPPYDMIVCVRVLINLRNLEEQELAVRNLASMLPRGGSLVLVEGFLDGFQALNDLRDKTGLPAMKPAAINFYSRLEELMPVITHFFSVAARFHTGLFDVLTRVAYPLLVGPENAVGPSPFHERMLPLLRLLPCDDLLPYARVRGFQLLRR
jgi:SAM-dependent methyltransferase